MLGHRASGKEGTAAGWAILGTWEGPEAGWGGTLVLNPGCLCDEEGRMRLERR